MSGGGESFTHVGVFIGREWRAGCHAYPDKTPILYISVGRMSFDFSVRDQAADQPAVDFARALVRNAQAFAAEVERLHAARVAADPDVPELDP